MGTSTHAAPRVADRLKAAGRARFVGREPELALFRSAILSPEPPFAVLHVHGPGGVGKTTLLREFGRIAQEAGRPSVRIDARNLAPAADVFLVSLRQALGVPLEPATNLFSGWPATAVLIIDTYEMLAPLDAWLRDEFLPQLPAPTLVVIAGRQSPSAAWSTDIEWAPLTRIVALRNLQPEESRSYLTLRGVPLARQSEVLSATFGHPLALSLAADSLARAGDTAAFDFTDDPDTVRVLLEKFVQDVPTAQHRLALYACAFAATTTEALLSAALGVDDARNTFDWLGQLSFVENGPYGLFPHELARAVLCADSRWRIPELRRPLNERLLTHLYSRFQRAQGIEQQRIWFDIIYLQRHNPVLRPFIAWGAICSMFAAPMRPEDAEPILNMVEQHEGAASRDIAQYWLLRQPHAFLAFRDPAGHVIGFMAHVRIEHATQEDERADPAVRAALAFIAQRAPARPGEGIAQLRFWMTRDGYQQPSPAMSVLAANSSLYWTTHPDLAWNLVTSSDPDSLGPPLASLNVWRAPQADFEVSGRKYCVFAHDWRVEPIAAWMRTKVDRATNCDEAGETQAAPELLVLSQADFAEAVRQALRDYTRADRLSANPLLRARLLANEVDDKAKVEKLRALLSEAANTLAGHPKDLKLHRALWHTFLQPAETHEAAAELLGLPFNTYRYQLARGVERATAWLWSRELRGTPDG